MRLVQKFISFSVIPMLLGITIVTATNLYLAKKNLHDEIKERASALYEQRKNILKNYQTMAISAIANIYNRPDTPENRELVKSALRSLRYSSDGYFFALDLHGRQIIHGASPSREGKERWNDKDSHGAPVIQNIIGSVTNGDGFSTYWTAKPSIGKDAEKLTYSILLDKYNWVLSTGFYIDDIQTELDSLVKRRNDAFTTNIYNNILYALIVSLFVTLLVVVLSKKTIKPIHDITDSLTSLADGEGDLLTRLSVKTKDEIHILASSFNRFIDKIHELVTQVANSSKNIFLSVRDLDVISDNISKRIDNHVREIEQAVTAITEMNSASEEIAANATNTASSTERVLHDAKIVQSVADSTVNSIENLVSGVSKASIVIATLANNTQKIESVVDVIKSIAEQINLLALNAAIEAARAGEQGRGFAVVADEVRSLAGRTQNSTVEINEMLKSLLTGVEQVVTVMQESEHMCQDTMLESSNIKECINNLYNEVTSITDMSMQIATATEEQSLVSGEINRNLVRVQELIVEIKSDFDMTTTTISSLANDGKQLDTLINKFKY